MRHNQEAQRNPGIVHHHPAALFLARLISVIFHPLFIPLYVGIYLLFWHPLIFAGNSPDEKIRVLASVFVNLTFLPAFSVFLLWRLKFSSSIYLHTQKERIIPLAAIMLFSFWCWFVFRNLQAPPPFVHFLLGVFISIIAAWMGNILFKISLHGIAVGGMLFTVLNTEFRTATVNPYFMCLAILITGFVLTARLIASDHKQADVYTGFLAGIFSFWLATIL
jgi:hypothetical protein